jgi:hypothetical protein
MKTNEMNRISRPTSVPVELPRRKPVHELRLGVIKAAIWENMAGETVRYNVTFSRIYKDEAEWKSSDTLAETTYWSWLKWRISAILDLHGAKTDR